MMGHEEARKRGLGKFELEMMLMCYEQKFMTRRQLMRWVSRVRSLKNMESAKSAVIRSMHHLMQERLVEIFPIYETKEREAMRLTKKGWHRLADFIPILKNSKAPQSEAPSQVAHDLTATDIRLTWEEILLRGSWISENSFWRFQSEHIPDAILNFNRGTNENYAISIEVELTQKSRERYEKKFEAFEDSDPGYIFYFSKDQAITNVIHEVSKNITDAVYVCQIDEFFRQREKAELAAHHERCRIEEKIPCWKGVEL